MSVEMNSHWPPLGSLGLLEALFKPVLPAYNSNIRGDRVVSTQQSVLWCRESFRYSLNEAWWFSTFFLQVATCHMLGVYFLYRDPFLRWKVLGTSGLQKLESHQCGYSLLHLYFRGVSIKDRPKPREGSSSSGALREYERSLFCTLNRFRAWAQLGLLILGTD